MSAGTKRLRRDVEGGVRRVVGLFVMLALGLGACGDEPASVVAEEPSTTAAMSGGSDDLIDENPLGSGSWTGARTTDDGLLITFVGGRTYEAGKPCSVDYTARATETEDDVRIVIVARSPARPADDFFACTAEGHFRSIAVTLERPLGDRTLIEAEFDRTQPVFDGSTLLQPTALPDGWVLLQEEAGYPGSEQATAWSRTWGPPRAAPDADGRCAPTASAMTLTQGPPAVASRPVATGGQPVSTHDVGGAEATLTEGTASAIRSLAWARDGVGLELTSFAGCEGTPPASEELLLHVARSLR